MESLISVLLEFTVKHPDLGGGGLPYKSDKDAGHLTLECNCKSWSHLGCLGWKVTH